MKAENLESPRFTPYGSPPIRNARGLVLRVTAARGQDITSKLLNGGPLDSQVTDSQLFDDPSDSEQSLAANRSVCDSTAAISPCPGPSAPAVNGSIDIHESTTAIPLQPSPSALPANKSTDVHARLITDAEWRIICAIREYKTSAMETMKATVERLEGECAEVKEECERLRNHHQTAIKLLASV